MRKLDRLAKRVAPVEVGQREAPSELRQQGEERREQVRHRQVQHEVEHGSDLGFSTQDGQNDGDVAQDGEYDDDREDDDLLEGEVLGAAGQGGRRVVVGAVEDVGDVVEGAIVGVAHHWRRERLVHLNVDIFFRHVFWDNLFL